jgi:hypothetical protein
MTKKIVLQKKSLKYRLTRARLLKLLFQELCMEN